MAHELFGTRFMDNRAPAWHRIGQVRKDPTSAVEGFDLIGAYDVIAVPMSLDVTRVVQPLRDRAAEIWAEYQVGNATLEDAERADAEAVALEGYLRGIGADAVTKALIRTATPDSPAKVLGTVKPEYEVMGPRQFFTHWDAAIEAPIETIGALKDGGVVFVSVALPGYDVKGDDMENYLLAFNGMNGSDSIRFDITSVRAVCMNTVKAAQSVASETLILPHTVKGLGEFEASLKDAYTRCLARTNAVQVAYDILAGRVVEDAEVDQVLAKVYPTRRRPSDFGPKLVVENRMRYWERDTTFAEGARASVKELLATADTCQTAASRGTAWGLYNGVVEFEDYRSYGTGPVQQAESSMAGWRAQRKEAGFAHCYALATGDTKIIATIG